MHNFLGKLFRYEQNPGTNYVEKVSLPVGVTFSQNYTESIAVHDPSNWTDFRAYISQGVTDQAWRDSINAGAVSRPAFIMPTWMPSTTARPNC